MSIKRIKVIDGLVDEVSITQVARQPVGRFSYPTPIRHNQIYDTPVAPLGLGIISLPMCYTPIAPLGLCRSGKMVAPQMRDIVGFHGFPFNPTYVLPNVNAP